MAEKIDETREESAENVSNKKKKDRHEPVGDSWSDLRALLLILVLTVIVFFILLYKQKHPQEYAESVVQAKEGADAAYSKAEEILPKAYRGVGWFFRYVLDYGKVDGPSPELPKLQILEDFAVIENAPETSSGSVSSTGSVSATGSGVVEAVATGTLEMPVPLVVEFSGYRLEFDRPPTEPITVTAWGAKMVLGKAEKSE